MIRARLAPQIAKLGTYALIPAENHKPLRQMMVLLKTIVSLCYGADPSVRAAIGYPRQFDDPHPNLAK